MTLNIKYIKDTNFKEPMVMLPLKQYEALIEYLEEAEDLLDIKKRRHEKNVSRDAVEKKFKRKFHVK
jgi:hypothetical protein